METLMIVIVLTFTPIPNTKNVEISYEAKIGVQSNLAACQAVQKAFDTDQKPGRPVIVICAESKGPSSAPSQKKNYQKEA